MADSDNEDSNTSGNERPSELFPDLIYALNYSNTSGNERPSEHLASSFFDKIYSNTSGNERPSELATQ